MEEFLLGALVGGLLFEGVSLQSGKQFGPAARLRAYLNRTRYERLVAKARARGFADEFERQWRTHSDCMPFEFQTGLESIRAFRRAEAISKQSAA